MNFSYETQSVELISSAATQSWVLIGMQYDLKVQIDQHIDEVPSLPLTVFTI